MSRAARQVDPWPPTPEVAYVRPSVKLLGADFGREELRHIALAIAALIAIFAAGLAGGITRPGFVAFFILLLPISVVACAPTFFTSILLQKRVGQKHGCVVEFRVQPQWLGISVFFSVLLGFVFAVPGSMQRFGNLSRVAAGRMALASPATFLTVAGAAAVALFFGGALLGDYGVFFLVFLIQITSLLALFQMLPVGGFPGLDIWRWSKVSYAVTLAGGVLLFAISRVEGVLF